MPDKQNTSLPQSLIAVKDLFGLSAAAKRLVEAIAHGVGRWAYPWEHRRNAAADIEVFRRWAKAFREEGLGIGGLDLSLGERTALRLTAQELRRQEHREAIAVQAVAEFRQNPDEFRGSEEPLDRE